MQRPEWTLRAGVYQKRTLHILAIGGCAIISKSPRLCARAGAFRAYFPFYIFIFFYNHTIIQYIQSYISFEIEFRACRKTTINFTNFSMGFLQRKAQKHSIFRTNHSNQYKLSQIVMETYDFNVSFLCPNKAELSSQSHDHARPDGRLSAFKRKTDYACSVCVGRQWQRQTRSISCLWEKYEKKKQNVKYWPKCIFYAIRVINLHSQLEIEILTLTLVVVGVVIFIEIFREQSIIIPFYRNVLLLWWWVRL